MRRRRQQLQYSLVCCKLLLLLLACACETSIKTDDAEVGEALEKPVAIAPTDALQVDTAKSEVTWIATKITGRHNGIFRLLNGELQLQENKITGGTLVIDMTSLQATDKSIGVEGNRKLTAQLKSADFFDVELYPMAVFEIISVAPYDSTATEKPGRRAYSDLKLKNPTHTITGNLEIKGTVKSITFPAHITSKPNELKARANFNIDRTKWGLTYLSDQSLGDKTIYSDVNIGFDIIAKP
ncbi:YceI family protein [Botryobacter ruber]|uniref:YceI family protein n=1 Tax=Botryobacter ruber TaxID=2171629 RepID=UPI000E0BE5AD|nr:YceI family protein [Botryobacter ruber]